MGSLCALISVTVGVTFLTHFLFPAFWAINFGVVTPLALSSLVVIAVIPAAARRGRFSVPLYALMLFAASVVAFIVGKVAGAQSVHGTTLGMVVSFIFFLLVATAVGCFLGILFYRHPSNDSTANHGDERVSSAMPALDKNQH